MKTAILFLNQHEQEHLIPIDNEELSMMKDEFNVVDKPFADVLDYYGQDVNKSVKATLIKSYSDFARQNNLSITCVELIDCGEVYVIQ